MKPTGVIVRPRRKTKPKYKIIGQVGAVSALDEIIDYFDCRDEQRLAGLARAVWQRLHVKGSK